MSDGRSIGGIDLDGCLVDGALLPWAQEIVDEVGSYCEISPSGIGVKIFFILEPETKVKLLRKHVQWPKHGSQKKAWGIECYLTGGRFFTVTGNVYRDKRTVEGVPVKKLKRVNDRMIAFDTAAKGQRDVLKAMGFIKNEDLPWDEWIKPGMALYNACWASPAGRDAWIAFSKSCLKYDEKETLERWGHWGTSPAEYLDAKYIINRAKEFGYEPEDDIADELGCREHIETFNKKWAQIRVSKKSFIMEDRPQNDALYSLIEEAHWKKLMKGLTPRFGKKGDPLHEIWLESRYRRQHLGIGLYPPGGGACPADVFNLWRGFGVEPQAGNWDRIKWHIKHIICRDDPVKYDYLFGLITFRLQFPGKKAGVCVVLRGDEGIGKTALVDILRRIFGVHIFSTAQKNQITGRFNSHMEHLLWLVTEEATWAGDKDAESVLKDLITGTILPVEGKFADIYVGNNLMDHIRITNQDWAVPAGPHARRFLMLDVSDEKREDRAYFGPLYEEIDGVGPAAMMWDLLKLDISGFDYRTVPKTAELMVQKKISMKSHEQYFFERAEAGRVSGMDGHRYVDKNVMMSEYEMMCSDKKLRPSSKIAVGMLLGKLGVTDPADRNDRRWVFPSLSEFRSALDRYLEQPSRWDDRAVWANES